MRYVKIIPKESSYANWRDHMSEAQYRFLRDFRNIIINLGDIEGPRHYLNMPSTIEEFPEEIPLKVNLNYYASDVGRVTLESIPKALFDISYEEKQVVVNGLRYM